MLDLLANFSFLNPVLLAGLALLPAWWWLMKMTPPKPVRIFFPPLRLLKEIDNEDISADSLPPWLLIFRLLLVAIVIIALANPIYNATNSTENKGPVVIVIDDGFASATDWEFRQQTAIELINDADRKERNIYILTTAERDITLLEPLSPMPHEDARALVQELRPKAWHTNRAALIGRLNKTPRLENSDVFWLADGVMAEDGTSNLQEFIIALARHGVLSVYVNEDARLPVVIRTPKLEDQMLIIPVERIASSTTETWRLVARESSGKISAETNVFFKAGNSSANATIKLPSEIRNKLEQLSISDGQTAASTYLMDPRWLRRPVGLLNAGQFGGGQPLLDETHYLKNALSPFFDIYVGSQTALLKRPLSVLVMGDHGDFGRDALKELQNWVATGGVLLRFAGPKLASSSQQLVPVALREGNRILDGAMSWSKPTEMGPFPKESPFATLSIPSDVRIYRQVLADPSPDLRKKSWAVLSDGTPLVTARKMGKGWLILFHITATPQWSNLALSGLFVEMLKKAGDLGLGVQGSMSKKPLVPVKILDGFGHLGSETGQIAPIAANARATFEPGPKTPPGIYGKGYAKTAFNFADSSVRYQPLIDHLDPAIVLNFTRQSSHEFMPVLLTIAFIMLLLDHLILLWMQGQMKFPLKTAKAATAITIILSVFVSSPRPATAEDINQIIAAIEETRLAYILTGDAEVDNMSKAGLTGLSNILIKRTSVETARPMGIDIETEEILFYPLVYWPVTAGMNSPSESVLQKLNSYMKLGGTVIFDTRNQNTASLFDGATSGSPENKSLQRILAKLDIPRLRPVDDNHVLTRAFYLMQTFPGRYTGGEVWVEDTYGKSGNDGVASIIIGAHDWAAAWAIDEDGRPIAAVIPGGERQREMAYRFGVNLVMYVLTGNYKADQVHVPAILERLGQ